MEAAIGSEEIWNQKQLAKAVGTSVASARVGGQARSLESIEASLRIAEGLREKKPPRRTEGVAPVVSWRRL